MKLIQSNRNKVFLLFLLLLLTVCLIIFVGLLIYDSIYVFTAYICLVIILCGYVENKFSTWLDTSIQNNFKPLYVLNEEEAKLWDSITEKANGGYNEFCEECKKDDEYMGWPWMSPRLTKEEDDLITKIHEYYYPGDYIVDPIGASQASYAWYDEIQHKVKYAKEDKK